MIETFPQRLIRQARKDSSGQLAWRSPAVFKVIEAIGANECAILGGDVLYADEDGTLDHWQGDIYCGNWYLNRRTGESWSDYVAQSLIVTRDYIEAYVQMNGDAYWFLPVFVDEHGYMALPGKQA